MAITAHDFKTEKFPKNVSAYIDAHPLAINRLVEYYLNEYVNDLLDYAIPHAGNMEGDAYRKALKGSINNAEPLRRGYYEVIDRLLSADIIVHSYIITRFFERLCAIANPALAGLDDTVYTIRSCFHFQFVRYEIFLNTVATALKYHKFDLIDELLSNRYLWVNRNKQVEDHTYNVFSFPTQGDHFNHDDLIALNESDKVDTALIKADMLCYFAGITREVKWRPILYHQVDRQNVMLDFLLRMRSKKYCEQIFPVFGSDSVAGLINKIEEVKDVEMRTPDFADYPAFSRYVRIGNLGTDK